jgi:regulator of protease activity HflC (stomatin/prohibitin superfamily)
MNPGNNVRLALWSATIVALVLAAFKPSLIWVVAPLLATALSYTLLRLLVYQPPENHLGVIYRFGRFSRWVDPDEWEVVIPGLDKVMRPISLHMRRVELNLSSLLTQDRVPVVCELVAYYQLDLRRAREEFRIQALRIPSEGWNSIIRTVLRETASEVIGGATLDELLTPEGRRRFKHMLSAELAQRVQGLGMLVNPRTGVSVQVLKPTDAVSQAMVDQFIATPLGKAALERVRPILKELDRQYPGIGWETLFLQWASTVVRDGAEAVPSVVIGSGAPTVPSASPSRDAREPAARSESHRMNAPYQDGEQEADTAQVDGQE